MNSPYAFTEEELKMMEKDYKKPKVLVSIRVFQFSKIQFRPRNGSCLRRSRKLPRTLFTRGAPSPPETS